MAKPCCKLGDFLERNPGGKNGVGNQGIFAVLILGGDGFTFVFLVSTAGSPLSGF